MRYQALCGHRIERRQQLAQQSLTALPANRARDLTTPPDQIPLIQIIAITCSAHRTRASLFNSKSIISPLFTTRP
jgi:hypothetical protein